MKNSVKTGTHAACLAVAFVLSASCADIDDVAASVITLSAETGQQTKLSGASAADESKINDITFFVFDDSGNFETSAFWTSSTGASCEVQNGIKKIYAIVNCAIGKTPETKEELLSTLSYLYDNESDNLVMFGETEEDISEDKEIKIQVKRLVGKVEIDEIKLDLKDGSRAGITINGIYLTNVNSSISFDGGTEASPDDWFNKAGYATSKADMLTYEKLESFIRNGDSHSEAHTFYAYPNVTSTDSHLVNEYCARYTRLVIDTDYGFYHLDIPGLHGNNSYIFKSVTITGEGSHGPEDEGSDCEAVLLVKGWENGESRIEYI